jgi:LysR family glycine cleavage system transcriptional activator
MKLPPLHALQCFECVGRKLSMKDAADELHVTAAAISQQITKLEEAIGIQLFLRTPRRIELTKAGKEYLRAIKPALTRIAEATENVKDDRESKIITLSCTNGFAMQWLLPRLARFNTMEPNIDVRINTTNRLVDLRVDGIDFAVRHGLGKYGDLEVELLNDDNLQLVCSPHIMPDSEHLLSVEDLKNYTLLHDEHRADWSL